MLWILRGVELVVFWQHDPATPHEITQGDLPSERNVVQVLHCHPLVAPDAALLLVVHGAHVGGSPQGVDLWTLIPLNYIRLHSFINNSFMNV